MQYKVDYCDALMPLKDHIAFLTLAGNDIYILISSFKRQSFTRKGWNHSLFKTILPCYCLIFSHLNQNDS